MKRLLLLGISVSLSGCLSSNLGINLGGDNVRMTKEHAQLIEKAGVISFIEAQPRVHFVSSSLKESNLESLVIGDWDATTAITNLMEGRLRQKGFKVVDVDSGIPFADAYSSSASYAEPDRLHDRLLAAGRRAGVDMLISYGLYKRHTEGGPYAYSAVQVEALNVNKGYVLGKADGTVKMELDDSAWQQNFETDKGPLRLSPVRADSVREKVIETLLNATMIAAQEAGISN